MSTHRYLRLTVASTVLALAVIVLGAYVRLTDAGLGCPDWPGCYGTLTVPRGEAAVAAANEAFPERPVQTGKAWREMAHRYVAGILGLTVAALAIAAWRRRRLAEQPLALPAVLAVLVVLQALLGMWTVTMLLKPAVVTAHLLGGMATVALLWWLALRVASAGAARRAGHRLRPFALAALAVLAAQIVLGGWTSTNYAALACVDFPTCNGQWLPWYEADSAFRIWNAGDADHEGGVLPNAARVTIHGIHRLGALITFLYIGGLAAVVLSSREAGPARAAAGAVLALLLVQVGLGIANVVLSLPLAVAVAHNGVAALLLLGVLSLIHTLGGAERAIPLRS